MKCTRLKNSLGHSNKPLCFPTPVQSDSFCLHLGIAEFQGLDERGYTLVVQVKTANLTGHECYACDKTSSGVLVGLVFLVLVLVLLEDNIILLHQDFPGLYAVKHITDCRSSSRASECGLDDIGVAGHDIRRKITSQNAQNTLVRDATAQYFSVG
eukprot:Protomagalhaensia_wolfi_Nauph_80__3987@NODE_4040_length_653_cov_6688_239414_g3201_i0_p2_GENE_NODE_4040_length_653_cov_6688_239414_g3201_i0NODE_4040_length_653_cov_6688_239414_g3201_i0_p2_ORF_typecomplete_len155_score10_32DAP10/PF07213_11/0_0048_NODE_4040_length_653_cov_6688_239414_g3201_i0142606